MVYANSLSEKAILEGVKKGKVYLKTKGPKGPEVSFHVFFKDKSWTMCDTIKLHSLKGQPLEIKVQYSHSSKQQLELIFNGEVINVDFNQLKDHKHTTIIGEFLNPCKGWLRFNLRDMKGITVVSNPIYLE